MCTSIIIVTLVTFPSLACADSFSAFSSISFRYKGTYSSYHSKTWLGVSTSTESAMREWRRKKIDIIKELSG